MAKMSRCRIHLSSHWWQRSFSVARRVLQLRFYSPLSAWFRGVRPCEAETSILQSGATSPLSPICREPNLMSLTLSLPYYLCHPFGHITPTQIPTRETQFAILVPVYPSAPLVVRNLPGRPSCLGEADVSFRFTGL